MSLLARIFALIILFFSHAAFAASDDWQVAKTSSGVQYTLDRVSWTALHEGDVVPNKAWIWTGPRARAQLVRGVETIGFQPNTLASITTTSGLFTGRKTQIVQQIGDLDLEIEKRNQPHTTVETPYLAAVVKGTIFHVRVQKTTASVSVDRGLVQVTSFASGQQTNVGPHQRATVDKKTGMKVAGLTAAPSITSVAPSVAKVTALGATTLSGQEAVSAGTSQSSAASGSASSSNTETAGESKSSASGASSSGASGSGTGNGGSRGDSRRDEGAVAGATGNAGSKDGGASGKGNNGNGNSGGNGNGNGNGNAGGNGNGNGNGNAGGNGNGNGNGNAGGNGNGNGNGNAGGNGNGNGNGNAGGNGNGNGNGNTGGNGNGNGNGNTGGNGNGNGNGNAGGNGNGNGNGNTGGNGNGNGNGNSGGNGNGKHTGNNQP